MADDADQAQAQAEVREQLSPRAPYEIPPGVPGDCMDCGEWSGRLIGCVCAPCRERQRYTNGGW